MRPLEILLLLALLPVVGRPFWRLRRGSWWDWLPGVAVLIALLHLVFEGYRWQMVPPIF